MPNGEFGSRKFSEREWQVCIARVHELALCGPVGADLLPIEPAERFIEFGRFELQNAVADQRNNGILATDAAHLIVETR